ncbi:adenosylcobinamide amidohydrolase [Lysinibacillus sp. MHQ-1]|nr:adenosylcobinamide amidohydrolase [Lysinibacillus sp. MHQ-1]
MPILSKDHIQILDQYVALQAVSPMKVVSSAMHNPGFGYFTHLMNRTVPITYDDRQPHRDLQHFFASTWFSNR